MKAQAKEERARKLAERDRLEREKQARLEAETRQMELEERLRQMEDEVRKAIHARMQTEETLKMMTEQVNLASIFAAQQANLGAAALVSTWVLQLIVILWL